MLGAELLGRYVNKSHATKKETGSQSVTLKEVCDELSMALQAASINITDDSMTTEGGLKRWVIFAVYILMRDILPALEPTEVHLYKELLQKGKNEFHS